MVIKERENETDIWGEKDKVRVIKTRKVNVEELIIKQLDMEEDRRTTESNGVFCWCFCSIVWLEVMEDGYIRGTKDFWSTD